jgi:hypothetical protein
MQALLSAIPARLAQPNAPQLIHYGSLQHAPSAP